MNEVFKFLQDCGIFFVSTVDGNQPKVRPCYGILKLCSLVIVMIIVLFPRKREILPN